ncbi:MAG: chorismate mutase [Alphaproteobacteria bacterium]|nr:chorismate mutase [Alphaproteobacteria bacterium]MCK5623763.1 chorismate mutase [Alphaproteobacteria bacterium]
MEKTKPNLDDLRREIDGIDTSLHDLIMRRAAIVEQVAEAKGPQADSGMRPGREAVILRRLAARHKGPFGRGSVLRIWREIIASLTAMQGPYSVSVFADDSDSLWDLARDHFGSYTALSGCATRREVVAGVAAGNTTHGVLPYPAETDDRPWWAGLWSAEAPRVVLRLPFVEPGNVRGRGVSALAIARVPPEASGDDRSLLLLEMAAEVRRPVIGEMLAAAGLEGEIVCAATDGTTQYLAEAAGFVEDDDSRLAALAKHENVERVRVIGAYPAPLDGKS